MKRFIVTALAGMVTAGGLITAAPPASAGCINPDWAGHPLAQMCDDPVTSDGMWVPRPVRVYASCACRGCRDDQPACRHHASQCCHDESLHGSVLPRRVFDSVVDVRRRVIEGGTPRMQ